MGADCVFLSMAQTPRISFRGTPWLGESFERRADESKDGIDVGLRHAGSSPEDEEGIIVGGPTGLVR